MTLTQISTGGIKDATIKNEDIEADTIQLTKLQNMATNHILGRSTSGTGNPEVLSAAQVRTILNVQTDVVGDTSPQLGGNLDLNSNQINGTGTINIDGGANTTPIKSITSNDYVAKFESSDSHARLIIEDSGSNADANGVQVVNNTIMLKCNNATGVEAVGNAESALYYNGGKKFETISTGAQVTGELIHLAGTYENGSGGYVRVKHDAGKFTCGAGNDCHWYHNGTNGYLENRTGDFFIMANNTEIGIQVDNNGPVTLYNNGFSQLTTGTDGVHVKGGDTASETLVRISGNEGQDAHILMSADEGDDTADHWRLRNKASDNSFDLVSYSGGTYKSVLKGTSNHVLELHYQGFKQAETMAKGLLVQGGDTSNETMLRITGNEGQDAHILMSADEGDDSPDHWRLRNIASTNKFDLVSYATGSYEPVWTATGGSDPNLGVRGALYIQNKNATQRYNTSYTDSVGVGFQPFGTNSLWYTHTYNNGSGSNTPGPYHYNLNSSNSGVRFYVKVNGGVVNHSGNNSNLCDERMKTNIVDAPSYYNSIKNIGIKKFNYKTEPEGTPLKVGVIAQQVETIESDLVDDDFAIDGSPNDESTTKMKSVHEEQLFMMGIKALQEAIGKIETLETKVAALEAA